ncbi:MAG: Maf family protein [Myxococcota bacterium]
MTDTEKRLILASGSSYKKDLMTRLGVLFETIPAYVDEQRHEGESPAAMAKRLAGAKAIHVQNSHPDAWIIGADQVIHQGERIFQKPRTPERAVEQLAALAGGTHHLLTAVSIASPGAELRTALVGFEMDMRPLTAGEIEAYVEEDQPLDCAGSYKVESGGIRLFRSLRGDDYTAIVGLPLTRVRHLLEQTGFFPSKDDTT